MESSNAPLQTLDLEVFTKVAEVIKEALSLQDREIRLGDDIQKDLGAESIDELDITFRTEKAFDIKLSRDQGGLFQYKVYKYLGKRYSPIRSPEWNDLEKAKPELFRTTVQDICLCVQEKLGQVVIGPE